MRSFTKKETETTEAAARGMSVKEAARAFGISPDGENGRRRAVLYKTGAKNMTEAVAICIKAGIICLVVVIGLTSRTSTTPRMARRLTQAPPQIVRMA